MRHPSEGVLRRLLDEPAGVSLADRDHVRDCASCLTALTDVRDDAALAARALAPARQEVDVEAAWQRLSAATAAAPPPIGVALRPRSLRRAAQRPAVAVLAAAVVVSGASAAAASGWLTIFRTERIAPVVLNTPDLVSLPDLSDYGTLEFTDHPQLREVDDVRTVEAETGLDVPEVTALPRGISGEPFLQVGDTVTATFTFSAERAREAAGADLPPVPPGLDGSAVRLSAGPGAVQVWRSDAGVPALLVARAVAPTASSTGVPFPTVRDYLLSLPGLPDDVAAQLRSLSGDGRTLPLPLPADEVSSRSTEVRGTPATLLTSRDRALAALVWVQDGVATVVAGSLDGQELLDVAEGLR